MDPLHLFLLSDYVSLMKVPFSQAALWTPLQAIRISPSSVSFGFLCATVFLF